MLLFSFKPCNCTVYTQMNVDFAIYNLEQNKSYPENQISQSRQEVNYSLNVIWKLKVYFVHFKSHTWDILLGCPGNISLQPCFQQLCSNFLLLWAFFCPQWTEWQMLLALFLGNTSQFSNPEKQNHVCVRKKLYILPLITFLDHINWHIPFHT